MLCALLVALSGSDKVGPALPAGCDTRFQTACLNVEERLQAGDFDGARVGLALLPTTSINVSWDDSVLPVASRAEFSEARNAAFVAWQAAVPGLRVVVAEPAAIQFSFRPSLTQEPGDPIPPGARHAVNDGPIPRVASVLSGTRGAPPVPITRKDVQNEVGYAIGLYLGLAPSPLYSHMMGRTEQRNPVLCKVTSDEKAWASANLLAAQTLREACEARVRLVPARSQIDITGPDPKDAAALQGEMRSFKVVVSAKGNAALNCRAATTCECLVTDPGGPIGPGTSRTITVKLDTTMFTGLLEKALYIYSNDPIRPIAELPIRCMITPRYRFLVPAGDNVLLDDGGMSFDMFLALPPDADIEPITAALNGIEGDVSLAPWEGVLPDPELNEGPKPREGYRVTVHLADQRLFGRRVVNLLVATTNKSFPTLEHTFFVQKGIVASPQLLYLGSELSAQPVEGVLVVSRPGKPFAITGIGTSLACVSAASQPVRGGWEYNVHVKYDGTAKPGPLKAMLDIHTDDPKQPIVNVAVTGMVK